MKFIINQNEYSAFDGLSFSPETDLMNNSLPINEFEARLFTNTQIGYGQWADLYDDNNNLWARYWLRYAERVGRDDDKQTYIVRIIGQSPIAFLERVKLPPRFLDDDAYTLIDSVLSYVGTLGQTGDIIRDSDIADEFESIHLTGFVPEQTARERLQWLLLASGGYVQSYNDIIIHINKIPTNGGAVIPIERTFWKPSVSFRDYVTKIKVHGYTFTQGTPESTDKYVTDGTDYWIMQEQVISLTNNNAPSGAPENEIEVEGVTLLSPTRASVVATNLAAYYFNRVEVEADVINNQTYSPGERVTVYTDEDTLYSGYIDRCDFSFGLQARSRLHLTGAQNIDGRTLTILYKWGNIQVAKRVYYLPKNYVYSITTEYLDQWIGGHRYVFRPTTAVITGTLSADTTQNVSVEVALEWYQSPSVRKESLQEQYDTVRNMLSQIYEEEENAIRQSYSGRRNRTKRVKYLNMLSERSTSEHQRMDQAFGSMIDALTNEESILHIESVDSVDYEDSAIYDPDDRTVVIE